MRLHAPAFEKALKRGVKSAVRGDPALRREYRRVKKGFRRGQITWPGRLIVAILPVLFVSAVVRQTHHADPGILALALWLLISTLTNVQILLHLPRRSRDIAALRLLPVSDLTVFQWERDKNLQQSLFTLFNILVGFAAIGIPLHFSGLQWLSIVALAPLTWAMVVTFSALCASRLPSFPYAWVLLSLIVLGLGLFCGQRWLPETVPDLMDRVAPTLNLFLPMAWPPELLHLVLGDRPAMIAILLLPIGIVLTTWRGSMEILARRFAYHEHAIPQAPHLVPGDGLIMRPPAPGSNGAIPAHIGGTAIADGISSGVYLARDEWEGGWIERALWRWFTPRERNLAGFAFPRPLSLTKAWFLITRNFLLTVLLGSVAMRIDTLFAASIFGFGLFIVCGHVMVTTCTTGVTFRRIFNTGVAIPFYAPFPMGMGELARMFLKCSLIQWPFVVLLAVAIATPLTHLTGQTWERGVLIGLRLSVVLFGARACLLGLVFVSDATDSRRFRPRFWLKLILFAVFASGFLVLASAGTLLPIEGMAWAASAGALAVGAIYYLVCYWYSQLLRVDLMQVPR